MWAGPAPCIWNPGCLSSQDRPLWDVGMDGCPDGCYHVWVLSSNLLFSAEVCEEVASDLARGTGCKGTHATSQPNLLRNWPHRLHFPAHSLGSWLKWTSTPQSTGCCQVANGLLID